MENKRTKYLMKNTIIFAIGSFASKFIAFFLVPFYTHLLTTKQYGIIDLIYTISIVIVPIITLNISESVMRFCLDKDGNEKQIMCIANKMFIISLIIMILIIPIFNIFSIFKGIEFLISLYIISTCGSQMYLLVIKGQEKLKLYTIGNIINTFLIAVLNILFLAFLKMGIKGYLIAYVVSNFITMIYALIISKSYKVGIKNYDKKLFSSMVKYSIVLIPTSFMWWIMNSSDRIMISNMVSTSANGIYAVSYKLPTLISTVISIFNQAWLFSAIKEMKSKDKNEYTNKIYKMLYTISIISGIGLIMITKIFMKYYVSEKFYEAWQYMSFLTIGVIFQSLATFLSTSYNVYKDNKGFLYSGVAGAILNIILNFILIPKFKIYGAAIATCASYIMVFIYRYFDTKKYIRINAFTIKNIIGFILLVTTTMFLYIDYKYSQIIQVLIFLISIVLYKEEILKIVDSIFKNKKSKQKRETMICSKNDCTGCFACFNACPKKAITMTKDEYGNVYPKIDEKKCINCGLCKKVCPQLKEKLDFKEPTDAYAMHIVDDKKRSESTSGGAATLFYEKVLNENGTIYGAANLFGKEQFEFIRVTKLSDLYKVKGSKYVHCYINNIFKEIKKDLGNDKKVLFIGTPCQVSGLKSFLMKEYDNLITVDIVCHGVPSQELLFEEIKSNKINLTDAQYIYFRDEKYFTFKVYDKNKKLILEKKSDLSNYYTNFLEGNIYRENCYNCRYAQRKRISDITIGDFWGLSKESKVNDNESKGISLIMTNTKKGEDLVSSIYDECIIEKRTIEEACAINHQLNHPTYKTKKYEIYIKNYPKLGYIKTMDKMKTIKEKIKYIAKNNSFLYSVIQKLKHHK